MLGDRIRRRDLAPMADHRFLHPLQITGIIDVPHEIDVRGVDADPVIKCGRLFHKPRSEEHTSELQSLMRTSYAVFCLKKKTKPNTPRRNSQTHHYIPHNY